MTNDFYSEQLITKNSSGGDTAKKVLIGIGAALISAFIFLALFMFLPMNLIFVGLVFYLAYFLMSGIDTEYEYIITNGDFDVDKIIGKRKRKRLLSSNIADFTAFGKAESAPDAAPDATTVLVTDGTGQGEYYADLKHKTAGSVRVIFTPNEKTLEGIVMFLPRQVKAEYLKNNR